MGDFSLESLQSLVVERQPRFTARKMKNFHACQAKRNRANGRRVTMNQQKHQGS